MSKCGRSTNNNIFKYFPSCFKVCYWWRRGRLSRLCASAKDHPRASTPICVKRQRRWQRCYRSRRCCGRLWRRQTWTCRWRYVIIACGKIYQRSEIRRKNGIGNERKQLEANLLLLVAWNNAFAVQTIAISIRVRMCMCLYVNECIRGYVCLNVCYNVFKNDFWNTNEDSVWNQLQE